MLACGSAYFTHSRFGILHTVDCLIVLISFSLELYLTGAEARVASLLTILRILRVIKLVSSAETGLEDYSDLGLAEQEKEAWQRERSALRAEIARLRGQETDPDLAS